MSDTATEVFLASSRNNDPACVGDPVIYTCSIINGRRLSWNFGEVCLFHYNPSREDYECGVYSMLNPGILRSTALPPDAEVSSVIAQNETSTVFNCTSILKITVTSPTTGNFTCIAVGEDGDVSKSHFYNVLGKKAIVYRTLVTAYSNHFGINWRVVIIVKVWYTEMHAATCTTILGFHYTDHSKMFNTVEPRTLALFQRPSSSRRLTPFGLYHAFKLWLCSSSFTSSKLYFFS